MTLLDHAADEVLAADLVERQTDDLGDSIPRDDDHAVAVAEDDIAGGDARAVVEGDRRAEVDDRAAGPLVLGIGASREDRKAEFDEAQI